VLDPRIQLREGGRGEGERQQRIPLLVLHQDGPDLRRLRCGHPPTRCGHKRGSIRGTCFEQARRAFDDRGARFPQHRPQGAEVVAHPRGQQKPTALPRRRRSGAGAAEAAGHRVLLEVHPLVRGVIRYVGTPGTRLEPRRRPPLPACSNRRGDHRPAEHRARAVDRRPGGAPGGIRTHTVGCLRPVRLPVARRGRTACASLRR